MKIGSSSPWGTVQSVEEIAAGIVAVSTSSHGGIWLSPARLEEMPTKFKIENSFYQGGQWFEEDCEWARVALAFPQFFQREQENARSCAPESLRAILGLPGRL